MPHSASSIDPLPADSSAADSSAADSSAADSSAADSSAANSSAVDSSAHVEVELKLLLDDEQAYAALRSWLDSHGDVRQAVQSNRYLDTTDRAIAARRMMMRIRVAGATVRCTAKAGARMVDGLMRVQEWEHTLSGEHAAAWLAGRSSCPLGDLPFSTALVAGPLADLTDALSRVVHVVGVMQTTRRAYIVPTAALGLAAGSPLTLELDHSLFPAGQERFELEVEHPDAATLRPAITALLNSLQIAWHPADQSKYQQFLRAQAMAPSFDTSPEDEQDGSL